MGHVICPERGMGLFATRALRACTVGLVLLIAARVEAGPLTVVWDRNTESDVAGYTLFYGTRPGQYTSSVDVGNNTTHTFPTLPPGTYYFAAQAYTAAGLKSPLSAEISTTIVPLAPPRSDMDGDDLADLMVWRPATGTWFYLKSSNGYSYGMAGAQQWGNQSAGDVPMTGDMDADGITDLIVWRASTATWYWLLSSAGYSTQAAGAREQGPPEAGTIPLVRDVDGDGKSDLIIWKPTTGNWHWLTSSSGYSTAAARTRQWGTNGDVPMVGDITGDGMPEYIVWRASTGMWYWLTSDSDYSYATAGAKQWGNQSLGDTAMLGDFDGDDLVDLTVWRASTGTWFWLSSTSGYNYAAAGVKQWGNANLGDVPLLGDFDGDGLSDLTVWRASSGTWFWLPSRSGFSYGAAGVKQWGSSAAGDVPILR
jgi:hypothetical protein